MLVACISGDQALAKTLYNAPKGDSPWTVKELCKKVARRIAIDEPNENSNDPDFHWKCLYTSYKWLCKIKHPTIPSAIHDALSTSLKTGQFTIVASPDVRPEDIAVKQTILHITIGQAHKAIYYFANSMKLDLVDERVIAWQGKMTSVLSESHRTLNESKNVPLPFTVNPFDVVPESTARFKG